MMVILAKPYDTSVNLVTIADMKTVAMLNTNELNTAVSEAACGPVRLGGQTCQRLTGTAGDFAVAG